ncbi:hypothetical protein VNI00_012940 [Paramarasmius palmivorus]|uniref:Uncharacterized protein n=1 Tax=Paramarasmius palmivorus TaxID=297713 RepID=A0AAW0BZV7_9AGAR
MPRQRLYTTRAEKQAANRQKWSKYYHKNKDKINAGRRKMVTQANPDLITSERYDVLPKDVERKSKDTKSHKGEGTRLSKQSPEFWILQLSNIRGKLENIAGKASDNRQRALAAYQFAISVSTDEDAVAHLDQLHSKLEKVQSSIYDCMKGVLENVGNGELFSMYEDFKGDLVVLLSWIADLTLQAMDGSIISLTNSFSQGALKFLK